MTHACVIQVTLARPVKQVSVAISVVATIEAVRQLPRRKFGRLSSISNVLKLCKHCLISLAIITGHVPKYNICLMFVSAKKTRQMSTILQCFIGVIKQ